MKGGDVREDALPRDLAKHMNDIGNRKGHDRAFMALIRNFSTWEAMRQHYAKIRCPTLLLYGDHDWSKPAERDANLAEIPNAKLKLLDRAGHFASLDAPDALAAAVLDFAG